MRSAQAPPADDQRKPSDLAVVQSTKFGL